MLKVEVHREISHCFHWGTLQSGNNAFPSCRLRRDLRQPPKVDQFDKTSVVNRLMLNNDVLGLEVVVHPLDLESREVMQGFHEALEELHRHIDIGLWAQLGDTFLDPLVQGHARAVLQDVVHDVRALHWVACCGEAPPRGACLALAATCMVLIALHKVRRASRVGTRIPLHCPGCSALFRGQGGRSRQLLVPLGSDSIPCQVVAVAAVVGAVEHLQDNPPTCRNVSSLPSLAK
mmetsp:Transcript_15661/g.44916  ORF Transcript_15661/g.44916 Transcript_15661/m.44916 type:complete len:233 (+) Transcript_15661:764-1462(+)